MKKSSMRWAYKTLILSISLSIVFSIVSQSMFPNLPIAISVFVIVFFIFVSVKFSSVIYLTVDNYYLRGFGFVSSSV